MSKSLNKVELIGHLGQDPELRYMPNGDAVATLSLATGEKWTDKANGEEKERTDWHRIVCFGKYAESAGKYLKKGSHTYVEGAIRYDSWQDENGQTKYGTKIIASNIIYLDKNQQPISTNHPEAAQYANQPIQGGQQPMPAQTSNPQAAPAQAVQQTPPPVNPPVQPQPAPVQQNTTAPQGNTGQDDDNPFC